MNELWKLHELSQNKDKNYEEVKFFHLLHKKPVKQFFNLTVVSIQHKFCTFAALFV